MCKNGMKATKHRPNRLFTDEDRLVTSVSVDKEELTFYLFWSTFLYKSWNPQYYWHNTDEQVVGS